MKTLLRDPRAWFRGWLRKRDARKIVPVKSQWTPLMQKLVALHIKETTR